MALFAAVLTLSIPSVVGQIVVIIFSGLLGRWMLKIEPASGQSDGGYPVSRRTGTVALVLLVLPLVLLPVWAVVSGSPLAVLLEGVYRAGALVFGGGHVVLPLLQAGVASPGWVGGDQFLTGYAAAQAVPGPLFSFAAYLGALLPGALGLAPSPWNALLLGLWMLAMIFLPALLLIAGCLPLWASLQGRPRVRRAMDAINASVVGMLLAALYDPVWTSAVHNRLDAALALALFGLLSWARLPALWTVLAAALTGSLLGA